VEEVSDAEEVEELKKVKNREEPPDIQLGARLEELEKNEAGLQFDDEGCFALGYF
jgi:hypothetical protein